VKLDSLIRTAPSWMRGDDDADGIVISCRARLARNLAKYPFASRITEQQQQDVIDEVLAAAKTSRSMSTATYFGMSVLDGDERRLLVERHLISPTLADEKGERGVLFNQDESLSVMINEEDHLRLQAISPGTRGRDAFAAICALDDELLDAVDCAHDSRLGFLTACPTNTGTGLRLSTLIHLPALVLTEDMERVLQGLGQLSFTVRGVYGEGSNATGNLFQISNQATLGASEESILEELIRITEQLIGYEREAQDSLMKEARGQMQDKVWRAFGLLSHARILTSQEFMNLLSAVRLGCTLGLVTGVPSNFLNHLMIATQPSHLRADAGRGLTPAERDLRRADLVREKLSEVTDS
jgi:protein arginine kinase